MRMNRLVNRNTVFLALALALVPQGARPDGAYFPTLTQWKQGRERALISEPAQKAVVFYRDGREQLIISPSYQGPPGGFAWVVPVPARPQVKVLRGALFHELARVVEPPPSSVGRRTLEAVGAAAPTGRAVTVLERETVGAYDVSVLSATEGGALQTWLARNGYALPGAARRPLAEYVREKWTFVACRVKTPRIARGLEQGTLAPLSLTFPARDLVYPMRLSSVNPRPFRLVLYLLRATDGDNPVAKSWPGPRPPDLRAAQVSPFDAPGLYPTLAGFGAKTLGVRWTETTVAPEDCTRDYVWAFAGPNSGRRRV